MCTAASLAKYDAQFLDAAYEYAGEVEKGRTEMLPTLIEQAMHAARELDSPRGVINFQCMVGDDNIPRWIELNARFGGGRRCHIMPGQTFRSGSFKKLWVRPLLFQPPLFAAA